MKKLIKVNHYKNLSISFGLIIIWVLTLVFSSYEQSTQLFNTFYLYFNFAGSIIISVVLSVLVMLVRVVFYKKINLRESALYTFFGYINLIISIIWIVALLMKILTIDYNLTESAIISCCLSIIILTDIYWIRALKKE